MTHGEIVPILDFGSQYAQLIARRVREAGVYSELFRPDISLDALRKLNPKGVILSGGPSSVYEPNAPKCDPKIFELGVPVLGICYGMQLGAQLLGGKVEPAKAREYGRAKLKVVSDDPFINGLPKETTVWMSHGDQVFDTASANSSRWPPRPPARTRRRGTLSKPFYGVQVHPEVTHTPRGEQLFRNFLYDICHCTRPMDDGRVSSSRPSPKSASRSAMPKSSAGFQRRSRFLVGHRGDFAQGDRQAARTCIFVDNGLLRKG